MNEETEKSLKQLGEQLIESVHNTMQGQAWSQAFLDARFDGSGGFSTKIRALTNSPDMKAISLTTDIDLVLIELDRRRRNFGKEWFGIMVTLSPDLRCSVEFNYDPSCADDETFFDS